MPIFDCIRGWSLAQLSCWRKASLKGHDFSRAKDAELIAGLYSGFDSAHYRKHETKWHFSQENATSHDFQMARLESKPL